MGDLGHSERAPEPRFSVNFQGSRGGWDDLVLPRGYLYLDGDETNAIISVGVNIGTKHCDPWLSFGWCLSIPPRLFWLIDWLYRRRDRRLSRA